MSADFHFTTIGSSQTVGNELLAVAQELFSSSLAFVGSFEGKAYSIAELSYDKGIDLFLCQPTRVEEAALKIPREKIVSLELIPDTRFYVTLSKIPQGEIVAIFNNNIIQAERTAFYCEEHGVDHIEFVYIAYMELSEQEVVTRLAKAKYIAGNDKIVGTGGILERQYQQYLRKDVKIIGAKRIPTVQSVCSVMQRVSLVTYKKNSTEIADVSEYLRIQLKETVEITGNISKSISMTAATITDVDANIKNERVAMGKTMAIADTFKNAVNNISGIAKSIQHISGQTSPLALNANITATRVGKQEQCFTVVAQEVRNLAQESQMATQAICRSVKEVQKGHLALKKYRDLLEKISRMDGLTGLANRRYFDEVFAKEWRHALQTGDLLTILLLDIDFFKKYNDSYGHLAGDACLQQVGTVLNESLKEAGDFVARYGGEEFVAILLSKTQKDALHVAEKVRGNIEALKINHQMSEVCQYVTVSVGVATVRPDKDMTPASLVDKADNALYQAKRENRNSVVVAGDY